MSTKRLWKRKKIGEEIEMENNKRKIEEENQEIPLKRARRDYKSLLDLSDDVLLLILQRLSHADLLSLNECCLRLSRVSADESLWKNVSTKNTPLPPHRFRKMLKFLGIKTRSITIGGKTNPKMEVLTPAILASIAEKCPQLVELSLESCPIDAEQITMSIIPKSIQKLSIRNCDVTNIDPQKSYLYQMDTFLPQLEYLDLTNSRWLAHHSLQAISKCSRLQELILNGCRRIGECFVYTALATKFGFRKVSRLDLRNTCVGDSEVPCFGRLPCITELCLGRTSLQEDMALQPAPGHYSESNGVVSDRGIVSLCLSEMDADQPGKLRRLILLNTDVSDRCLAKLAAAFALHHLDVRGTGVTAKGVQCYVQNRPTCEILHD